MKKYKILGIVFLWLLPFGVISQTKALPKLSGYSRAVLGGAARADENGMARNNIHYIYSIFLESKSSLKPEIGKIWIKQQAYDVQVIAIKKLPVSITSEKKEYTLIKKTKNKVWQLLITPDDSITKSTEVPKESATNEIVVIINKNSKKILLKKITELPQIIAE